MRELGFIEAGGMQLRQVEHQGLVAVELPSSNVQPVLPILTDYVLAGAPVTPDGVDIQGDLFPRRRVSKINFQVGRTDGSEQVRHQTKRQDRGEIRYSNFGWSKEPFRTERRTFAGMFDDRERDNADPWDVAGRSAAASRVIVERDTLGEVADIVGDDANYQFVETIGAGDGWNLIGGSRELISDAAARIEAATAIPRPFLRVALFGKARQAALADTSFLATRTTAQRVNFPDFPELAAYWGVGSVRPYYALEKPSLEEDAVEMFADAAVIYYPGNPAQLSSLEGGLCWGGTFEYSPGDALIPYRLDQFTSWFYPWQNDQTVLISKTECAVKIKTPWQDA
jgi:hypothetical protein